MVNSQLGSPCNQSDAKVQQQGAIQEALEVLDRRTFDTKMLIDTIFNLIVLPTPTECDPGDKVSCAAPQYTVAQKLDNLDSRINQNNIRLSDLAQILREQLGEEFLI